MEQPKQTLPNSTAVLVLGICSIVFGCGGVGLILGIIGLVLASKGRKMYHANPAMYEGYGALNAGFIMSIIGVCLGGFSAIWFVLVVMLGLSGGMWHVVHDGTWQ